MSIQANINQTLSLAGLLASQTPVAHARKAEKEAEMAEQRALSKLERRQSNLDTQLAQTPPHEHEHIAGIVAEQQEIAKERYNISPTQKNLQSYYAARDLDMATLHEELRRADPIGAATEDAMIASAQKQKAAQADLALQQERARKSREFSKRFTEGSEPSYRIREVLKYGKE